MKQAYNEAWNEFSKKEAKQRTQNVKRRELYTDFKKKQKELDMQLATSDDDEE